MKATDYQGQFKIVSFRNRGGSMAHRVIGMKRNGNRVRENFADVEAAQCRKLELETEYLSGHTETTIQPTKLTGDQIRLAEAAFLRIENDDELLPAVEYWLKHGKAQSVTTSPRLDDAHAQFLEWLAGDDSGLRDLTKTNLRRRVNVFVNSVPNMRVADVTKEAIQTYLSKRAISPKSKDNDRRALSSFFSWCMDDERKWTAVNPCSKKKKRIGKGKAEDQDEAPDILGVEDCETLLRAAEAHKGGRMVPYLAVCLFAGLRPFEAARLPSSWSQVNLPDNEIRLEASQTKTGRSRVVTICPTLRTWLEAYRDHPFYGPNWRRDFDMVKRSIGYGRKTPSFPNLKPWPVDVLRHTAISHYFRQTGSYGQTAEQFGNSEAIIKNHYQGRVSSDDTARFYDLRPAKKIRPAA
jgi:integrase